MLLDNVYKMYHSLPSWRMLKICPSSWVARVPKCWLPFPCLTRVQQKEFFPTCRGHKVARLLFQGTYPCGTTWDNRMGMMVHYDQCSCMWCQCIQPPLVRCCFIYTDHTPFQHPVTIATYTYDSREQHGTVVGCCYPTLIASEVSQHSASIAGNCDLITTSPCDWFLQWHTDVEHLIHGSSSYFTYLSRAMI